MLTTSLNPSDKERAAHCEDVVTFLHKPLILDKIRDLIGKYFKEIVA